MSIDLEEIIFFATNNLNSAEEVVLAGERLLSIQYILKQNIIPKSILQKLENVVIDVIPSNLPFINHDVTREFKADSFEKEILGNPQTIYLSFKPETFIHFKENIKEKYGSKYNTRTGLLKLFKTYSSILDFEDNCKALIEYSSQEKELLQKLKERYPERIISTDEHNKILDYHRITRRTKKTIDIINNLQDIENLISNTKTPFINYYHKELNIYTDNQIFFEIEKSYLDMLQNKLSLRDAIKRYSPHELIYFGEQIHVVAKNAREHEKKETNIFNFPSFDNFTSRKTKKSNSKDYSR